MNRLRVESLFWIEGGLCGGRAAGVLRSGEKMHQAKPGETWGKDEPLSLGGREVGRQGCKA